MKIQIRSSFSPLLALGLFLSGCSTSEKQSAANGLVERARGEYREARRQTQHPEISATHYIEAAEAAWQAGKDPATKTAARTLYNNSVAELTVLLRSADGGRLWKSPVTLSAGGVSYRLDLQSSTGPSVWMNGCFTSFIPAREINERPLRTRVKLDGFGGALVGVRKTNPLAPFMPMVGNVAPVTATLSFHGHNATLALNDPTVQSTVTINGVSEPLAADFSAPIAYLPRRNELWAGLMGLIDVQGNLSKCGLYAVQPYDPNKIPVIFIHGLVSTPQIWFNDVNELAADPEIRKHYQCWAFWYPTGNPAAYSALLMRENLAKMKQLHPQTHNLVLVGHSMGGLVARMQATNTGRAIWDQAFGKKADSLYAKLPPDNLIKRGVIFNADPDVKRIVFICTPHRGSEMALSSIGAIGMALVHLPANFVKTALDSVGDALDTLGGKTKLPTSIQSLSPKSPALIAMDKLPVQAPYHSIIGDRGRGDTPNSSDGVVPYWSSHLKPAQSELIVPGPHGSQELPQTVDELKRILRLHLKSGTN
jgi:pimeloyl-ACP methyl ester carboxylesterase